MNSNILKLMVCATIPVALLSCKKDEEPVKTDYIISQYEIQHRSIPPVAIPPRHRRRGAGGSENRETDQDFRGQCP